jgi:hypothetical protein
MQIFSGIHLLNNPQGLFICKDWRTNYISSPGFPAGAVAATLLLFSDKTHQIRSLNLGVFKKTCSQSSSSAADFGKSMQFLYECN